MNRVYPKRHLSIDVLEAARNRFDTMVERYDDHWVAFSGGKDSLTCLHLLKEAYDRAGITRPIKVQFYDEELIPDSVINFVDEYRQKDWIELYWFVYPLQSNKFLLGKVFEYTQWDPNREHVRQPPAWGIFPEPGQKGPFSQYTMSAEMLRRCKARGRIAGINGMRADESMNRYCAAAGRIVDNWIHGGELPQVDSAMPIYDWSENDVMKYLGQEGIRYCPMYDRQLYARTNLRISTPIHTGSAGRVGKWREMDPDFFERVMRLFPEMLLQDRYYKDLNQEFEPTLEALEAWIRANVDDKKRGKAMGVFNSVANQVKAGYFGPEDWPDIWNLFRGGTWLKAGATGLRARNRIA